MLNEMAHWNGCLSIPEAKNVEVQQDYKIIYNCRIFFGIVAVVEKYISSQLRSEV